MLVDRQIKSSNRKSLSHRVAGILAGALLCAQASAASAALSDEQQLLQQAEQFPAIRTMHIAHKDQLILASGLHGGNPDAAANIKSASKLLMSAMVGVAIEQGLIESVHTPVATLLPDELPTKPDPRLQQLNVGHLLSMQAGLERTSGQNYGRWVNSANWVRYALSRPFVDEPGGEMLYSSGNTHMLSAIIMDRSGHSTYRQFNEWFAGSGARVSSWITDPQGIPMGGNQVSMTPASLLEFGEVYRRGGLTESGERILSEEWIAESWQPRTQSIYTDDEHGYAWFLRDLGGYQAYYGWGYGGQMLYVVPELELTVVITSDTSNPSGRSGYARSLHRFVSEEIIPRIEVAQES
ncbi:CubicO group peptidase, beta-lactamase class C family [Marinobacterium lutimaris]|uniref:CubicO group peptidase, beta-lactamase class C family n=1 Tax=Marinobacterium lutimaris TaxID=568106 RepID=A0A1H5WE24_9GAMM|nr:CubicO group peptidase, beta-lactamase class C family [Marinobacterium lutimaris]